MWCRRSLWRPLSWANACIDRAAWTTSLPLWQRLRQLMMTILSISASSGMNGKNETQLSGAYYYKRIWDLWWCRRRRHFFPPWIWSMAKKTKLNARRKINSICLFQNGNLHVLVCTSSWNWYAAAQNGSASTMLESEHRMLSILNSDLDSGECV